MIIVDTSVWIDYFRGTKNARVLQFERLIANLAPICSCRLIYMEVLQGVKEQDDFDKVKSFLESMPILEEAGLKTYVDAAQIHRRCRKKGRTIKHSVDCLIAAIAIEHDAEILHNDKDFDDIASVSSLKVFPAVSGL